MPIIHRVGDHLLSINGEPLKSFVETEQLLKRLPKGQVKIVAMPPLADTTNGDWSQYIVSSNEEGTSDKGIITVEVSHPSYTDIAIYILQYTRVV